MTFKGGSAEGLDSNSCQRGRSTKGGKIDFRGLYKSRVGVNRRGRCQKNKKNPCPKSFQAARRLIKTPDEREQNKTRPTCWPGGGWRGWALLSQQSGKENPSSICWRPPAEEASAGNQGSRVIIRRGRCRQHSSGWRRLRSRCCRSGIDFRKRFRGFRGVGCNVIK